MSNQTPPGWPRPLPRQGQYRQYAHPGRSQRIHPSFTDDEIDEIAAAARHTGLTLTGYCAQASLDTARNNHTYTPAEQAELQALARLQVELSRARAAINHTRAEIARAAGTANPSRSTQTSLNKVIAQAARSLTNINSLVMQIHEQLDQRPTETRDTDSPRSADSAK